MAGLLSTDGWSMTDMPDQAGRTVVITGANSGIGFEASKAFARTGADVVMACRSVDRGRRERESIRDAAPEASLSVRELDLADLDSIRSFADRFAEERSELHVLCNNAGVMAIPRKETADGFESQFGVNHLGHFALTGRLLETLRDTDGETRVVTQSSGVHESGEIHFEDLNWEQSYDKWGAYAQSKLANVLFAYELDRRLRAADADAASVACHPGYAATNLQTKGPEMEGSTVRVWAMRAANAVFAQSAKRGTLPLLYAATRSDIEGGEYIGPGGIGDMRGAPEPQKSSDRSYDETAAKRLWERSEELTGVEFDLAETASVQSSA